MKATLYFYSMGQRYARIYPSKNLGQCIMKMGLNPSKEKEYPCNAFVDGWLDVFISQSYDKVNHA